MLPQDKIYNKKEEALKIAGIYLAHKKEGGKLEDWVGTPNYAISIGKNGYGHGVLFNNTLNKTVDLIFDKENKKYEMRFNKTTCFVFENEEEFFTAAFKTEAKKHLTEFYSDIEAVKKVMKKEMRNNLKRFSLTQKLDK